MTDLGAWSGQRAVALTPTCLVAHTSPVLSHTSSTWGTHLHRGSLFNRIESFGDFKGLYIKEADTDPPSRHYHDLAHRPVGAALDRQAEAVW